ncbi:MAG: hypothetical protein HQK55_08435 [Deltaproteobacteria bacterium]|nr:hypothetical protein [Deltaproteobacteria bacterium]
MKPIKSNNQTDRRHNLTDHDLFRISPFLADLAGDGSWGQLSAGPIAEEDDQPDNASNPPEGVREFLNRVSHLLTDPEAILKDLRQFRIRSLLSLAAIDLSGRIQPHQLRRRLIRLNEALMQAAWHVADECLRQRFVHPLVLERRNVNPPMAVFSLSRLGSGDPWYTTGPSPIFVHTRAAEFAPSLSEKDFAAARRTGKEWLPAREYFHRLARRILSFLSVPDAAGKGFDRMAEEPATNPGPSLLPGSLVVLYSAFEEHFGGRIPLKERLSLLRLRFITGQEPLGRAVETLARESLRRLSLELGPRLRPSLNAWYRDRAQAEHLPLDHGSLLDIERGLRLIQFRCAVDDPEFLEPSPCKSMDFLAGRNIISREQRLILFRSYSWQWFLINRMSLLDMRTIAHWQALKTGSLDETLDLPNAATKTVKLMKSAHEVLKELES